MARAITYPRLFLLLVAASILGGLVAWQVGRFTVQTAPAAPPAEAAEEPMDLKALQTEVAASKASRHPPQWPWRTLDFTSAICGSPDRGRIGHWRRIISMRRVYTFDGWSALRQHR